MNARVVGIALICAIAALGAPYQAAADAASGRDMLEGGALGNEASRSTRLFAGQSGIGGSEMMLRRQPAPVSPRRAPLLRRLRKGTISLGGQIGYGFVRGTSELNDHFDRGPGYAFRFRYMVSSRAALGFSFENQKYGVRAGLPPSTDFFASDSELVVTTVASEMVVYFHRERETTPYLVGGLGLASPNVNSGSKSSRRVDEGPFLVVGAGIERFLRPRLSLDFSVRGFGEVGNSELSVFSQVNAGIHLYPGD